MLKAISKSILANGIYISTTKLDTVDTHGNLYESTVFPFYQCATHIEVLRYETEYLARSGHRGLVNKYLMGE